MVKIKEIEYVFPHKGLHLFPKYFASVFYKLHSGTNGKNILKRTVLSETVYLLYCYQGAAKEFGFFVIVNAGVGFALTYHLNDYGNLGLTLQVIVQMYTKMNTGIITLCVIVPAI